MEEDSAYYEAALGVCRFYTDPVVAPFDGFPGQRYGYGNADRSGYGFSFGDSTGFGCGCGDGPGDGLGNGEGEDDPLVDHG